MNVRIIFSGSLGGQVQKMEKKKKKKKNYLWLVVLCFFVFLGKAIRVGFQLVLKKKGGGCSLVHIIHLLEFCFQSLKIKASQAFTLPNPCGK